MKQEEVAVRVSLVYVTANSLMSKDISLEDAIHVAKDAGADGFELRRELLPTNMQPSEIQDVHSLLEKFPTPPAYSVPSPLFAEGRLKRDFILQALDEARSFGCQLVKFSPIGMEPGNDEFTALTALLSQWQQEAPAMRVMVENDQTVASGSLEQWIRFFEQAANFKCPIGMTFDVGNWDCVGVNAVEAAHALGRFAAYIHAKSVERKDGQWIAQPIRPSSSPHPVLKYIAPNVPRAIEFPVASAERTMLIKTLHAYIVQIRSGDFVT